jgi:hypothetical protein
MNISKKNKWKAISFKFADLYAFVHTCKIVQNNMFFKANSSTEINTQRVSRGTQGLASDGNFGLQGAGRRQVKPEIELVGGGEAGVDVEQEYGR